MEKNKREIYEEKRDYEIMRENIQKNKVGID